MTDTTTPPPDDEHDPAHPGTIRGSRPTVPAGFPVWAGRHPARRRPHRRIGVWAWAIRHRAQHGTHGRLGFRALPRRAGRPPAFGE